MVLLDFKACQIAQRQTVEVLPNSYFALTLVLCKFTCDTIDSHSYAMFHCGKEIETVAKMHLNV